MMTAEMDGQAAGGHLKLYAHVVPLQYFNGTSSIYRSNLPELASSIQAMENHMSGSQASGLSRDVHNRRVRLAAHAGPQSEAARRRRPPPSPWPRAKGGRYHAFSSSETSPRL